MSGYKFFDTLKNKILNKGSESSNSNHMDNNWENRGIMNHSEINSEASNLRYASLVNKKENLFEKQFAKINETIQDLKLSLTIPKDFEVGFIGKSQVGKSTLINSLLADDHYPRILPSGGIGPLTAISISIKYGEQRRLIVEYHQPTKLSHLIKETKELFSKVSMSHDEKLELDKRVSELNSLITGKQNTNKDINQTINALEIIINNPFGLSDDKIHFLNDIEKKNAKKVHFALNLLSGIFDIKEVSLEFPDKDFHDAIKDHSAGCLSPLVKKMTLEWPKDFLKSGVVLTDLPGVGVVGDRFPEVTRQWMQNKSRSVVFVTDNSGIDEPSARVLKESGFIQRILLEKNDPTLDPIELIIAVTQMDRLLNDKQIDKEEQAEELFEDLCNQMSENINNQLRKFIADVVEDEFREDVKLKKQEYLTDLLNRVKIIPLSANEFINLTTKNKRAQFKNIQSTNVPALINSVETKAVEFKQNMEIKVNRRTLWIQDYARIQKDAAISEIKNLEMQIDDSDLFGKYEREFKSSIKGMETRSLQFLKSTSDGIVYSLNQIIEQIRNEAISRVNLFCDNDLRNSNWNTLKAALVRGGTFQGARKIDIQESTANLILEAVAVRLTPVIFDQILSEVNQVKHIFESIISEAINWLVNADIPQAKKAHFITRLANYKSSNQFLYEGIQSEINMIKERIRILITNDISVLVSGSCELFIRSEESSGNGVKSRMIDAVKRMMKSTIDEACNKIESFSLGELRNGELHNQLGSLISQSSNEILTLERELDLESRKKETELREQIIRDVKPYIEKFEAIEHQIKEIIKAA